MARILLWLTLAVLLAPLAGAQGDDERALTHMSVKTIVLEGGASERIWVEPGSESGEPWKAGMIFVMFVCVQDPGHALAVSLDQEGTPVEAWSLAGESCYKLATRVPKDLGPYHIEFSNLGSEGTAVAFFFDQTCSCTLKYITMPRGFVIFQYDLVAGTEYNIAFPTIEGWDLVGRLMLHDPAAPVSWPESFQEVQRAEQAGKGWLNLTITPTESRRHYVVIEERAGVSYDATGRPIPVTLTPLVETTRPGNDSPGAGAAFVLLTLGALVAARRRSA